MLTYGSLFSGIGGIDLGLDRAGMHCQWQVEIDEYAQKVLAKHWPNVARFRDVRDCGRHNLETVDLICGGFPCQDISNAGRRAGITGERSGLWSEFYRIICELRPRYILVENVAALLTRGIDRVLGDLAASGYDAEWQVLPASAFGAPHKRDRVFIVGYSNGIRCNDRGNHRQGRYIYDNSEWDNQTTSENWERLQPESGKTGQDVSNASSTTCGMETHRSGRQGRQSPRTSQPTLLRQEDGAISAKGIGAGSEDVADAAITGLPFRRHAGLSTYATQAGAGMVFQPQRRCAIEQSIWWATEPDVGRVANGVPARVDRLRTLGNAVVPQVAEYIGRRIIERLD